MKLQVGIILRLSNGAPPVVIAAFQDDALLSHAIRAALIVDQRRARLKGCVRPDFDALLNEPIGQVM